MKIKSGTIVFFAFLTLVLVSCGQGSAGTDLEDAQSGAVNIEAPSASGTESENGEEIGLMADEENASLSETGEASDTDSGIFTVSGQELYLGMALNEEKLAPLGTPKDVMEAPSCHFDGNDTIFVYDDFSLYTYLDGENNILYLIELTGENAKTALRAHVGMSLTELQSLYGEGTEEGAYLTYSLSETTALHFGYEEDIVTWIEYVEAKQQ